MAFFDPKKQKSCFDQLQNRYHESLIFFPPFHTVLEIKSILDRLKNQLQKDEILDFGAGSGRLTIPLLEKGFTVWASDISEKSLFDLKKLAQEHNLTKLKTSTAFPQRKFAAIVGADVLHHVNIDKYLPKIHHSLQPKGKIVFSEPGAFNPAWYLYLRFFADWEIEKGVMTCRYFNLLSKLKAAGFKNIKIIGLGLLPRPFFNWCKPLVSLNDKLGNLPLLKFFAYRYIIEATA